MKKQKIIYGTTIQNQLLSNMGDQCEQRTVGRGKAICKNSKLQVLIIAYHNQIVYIFGKFTGDI